MAQLIVRDLDDDLVRRLKRRAGESGHSAEEEHPPKKSTDVFSDKVSPVS